MQRQGAVPKPTRVATSGRLQKLVLPLRMKRNTALSAGGMRWTVDGVPAEVVGVGVAVAAAVATAAVAVVVGVMAAAAGAAETAGETVEGVGEEREKEGEEDGVTEGEKVDGEKEGEEEGEKEEKEGEKGEKGEMGGMEGEKGAMVEIVGRMAAMARMAGPGRRDSMAIWAGTAAVVADTSSRHRSICQESWVVWGGLVAGVTRGFRGVSAPFYESRGVRRDFLAGRDLPAGMVARRGRPAAWMLSAAAEVAAEKRGKKERKYYAGP
ncbi:hypothetical protein PLESTF_001290900 [Pleodorina starrii]|nr:hypothetical protein PLESTF_001290900 [Pleodorina starrii]